MSILPLGSPFVTNICKMCQKPAPKQCSKCQEVFYCSVICQTTDWKTEHKKICGKKEKFISVQDSIMTYLKILTENQTITNYTQAKVFFETKAVEEPFKILPTSKERTLMMIIFFAFPGNMKKPFDEFLRIPGIEIIKKDPRIECSSNCANFVFKGQPWYDSSLNSSLFEFSEVTLDTLNKKGYMETKTPKVGCIVVYSSSQVLGTVEKQKISHYGKISQVLDDGTVIVQSQFIHTYEHRLELIPYFFGNLYMFLELKSQG